MTAPFGPAPAWGPVIAAARRGDLPLLRLGMTPEEVARVAAGIVYVATPYSRIAVDAEGAWDYAASYQAMMAARAEALQLVTRGVTAIAPIAIAADACHATFDLDPLDDAFWTRWCAPLLAAARVVVVPAIEGWDRSAGIWREVRAALGANKPVHLYAEG